MRVREVLDAQAPLAHVPGRRIEVLQLLLARDRAAVAVVKEGTRKLAGVVTRADLLAHPDEEQTSLLMDPNPTTTYAEATLEEAGRLLVAGRRPLLCVVSGSNDVLGVLSPLNLVARLPVPRGLLLGHLQRAAVPVHRATPAPVALEILRATGSVALPVLDDDGLYAGLVGDGDLLRRAELLPAVHAHVREAPTADPWSWETGVARPVTHHGTRLELPTTPVGEFADRDAPTLAPTAPLEVAVRLVRQGERVMPVVDSEGRVRDLVTDLDVLEAALDALR